MKQLTFLHKALAALLIAGSPLALAADRAKAGGSAGGPGASGAEAAGAGQGTPDREAATTRGNANLAKGNLSKDDQQFVQKAAQGGMMEVRLGEVASQKAMSPQVKELGSMMVKDHSKANNELKDLAGKKGFALSTELESKHQSTVDRLGKLSGEEFDKAYVNEMVSAHKKDVDLFEKAAKSADDADLKAWAGKTLPTLQGHLQHVQGMKKGSRE